MDKLIGKQKELDANNDGEISGQDFKLLRAKKATGGQFDLHEDFVDSNDRFILRMAKMSMQDVKNEKDRDEVVKLYIQDKSKVAKTLGLDFDKDYYTKEISNKIRELAEEQNPLLGTRQIRQEGGLLNITDKIIEDTSEDVGYPIYQNYIPSKKSKRQLLEGKKIDSDEIDKINNHLYKIYEQEVKEGRTGNAKRIAKRIDILEKEKIKLESSRNKKQEGGPMSMDDQMQMAMNQPMMPDEEMEDNYLDFIIDEALDENEEEMLMSKLEQDEQLSMLFDKVLEVASEFAGSGPVDGPGTGVSDSIPARLSDGEFVFTAKATEEIGADELMRMMKDAEAQADERQQVAVGGMIDSGEEEVESNINRQQVINEGTFIPEEDTTVRDKVRQNMMDPSAQSRYVRS